MFGKLYFNTSDIYVYVSQLCAQNGDGCGWLAATGAAPAITQVKWFYHKYFITNTDMLLLLVTSIRFEF